VKHIELPCQAVLGNEALLPSARRRRRRRRRSRGRSMNSRGAA